MTDKEKRPIINTTLIYFYRRIFLSSSKSSFLYIYYLKIEPCYYGRVYNQGLNYQYSISSANNCFHAISLFYNYVITGESWVFGHKNSVYFYLDAYCYDELAMKIEPCHLYIIKP